MSILISKQKEIYKRKAARGYEQAGKYKAKTEKFLAKAEKYQKMADGYYDIANGYMKLVNKEDTPK